jgi:general secretion pathway protein D
MQNVNNSVPQGMQNFNNSIPQSTQSFANFIPQGSQSFNNSAPQGTQNFNNSAPQGATNFNNSVPQVSQNFNNSIPQGMQSFNNAAPQGSQNFNNSAPQGFQNFNNSIPQGMQNFNNSVPQNTQSFNNSAPQGVQTFTNLLFPGTANFANSAVQGASNSTAQETANATDQGAREATPALKKKSRRTARTALAKQAATKNANSTGTVVKDDTTKNANPAETTAKDDATKNANPSEIVAKDDATKTADPAEIAAKDDADPKISDSRISYLTIKARGLVLVNEIDEAYEIAQSILRSDPQNEQANAIIACIKQKKLEDKDGFPSNVREARERLITEIRDTWQMPQISLESVREADEHEEWSNMFKRLNRIIIPKISFNNTPLSQAINTIVALTEQYDNEPNDAKKGVNMIVINPPDTPESTITLELKNMPLDKILNFIAKASTYQFDIEDEVIVFRKMEGGLSENLDTKFFKISRSAIVRMTGIQSSSSGASSSGGDKEKKEEGSSSGSIAEEERLIKEFLQKAGVNFAGISGSNLAYDGSQLIVTQSLRNIKRVKEILAQYEQVQQVEIETKFIEIQQNKLDELGFSWSLDFNRAVAAATGAATANAVADGAAAVVNGAANAANGAANAVADGAAAVADGAVAAANGAANAADGAAAVADAAAVTTAAGAAKKILLGTSRDGQSNLRALTDAFTIKNAAGGGGFVLLDGKKEPIPSSAPSSPGGLNLGASAFNIFDYSGVITDKIGIGLAIRALEQQSNSDLMSAPKLTVLSGRTAKIVVAQEFIYPKTWGEISSEVGTGDAASAGVTITAGTPSDFETRNVGVELNVTPTVEKGNCISLQLTPKVTEFEGFIEYGGRSIAIQGNTTVQLPPGFYQPIFSTREIETEVTIYDGSTVVMGGLTREEIKEVSDKIPLLGDIPLIGRLFRSKGETVQKKNLLIFVTANILSPGGVPVRNHNSDWKEEPVYRTPKNSF